MHKPDRVGANLSARLALAAAGMGVTDMTRIRTVNKRLRRKRQVVPCIRMGRCPTLWHWTDPEEAKLMGVPFKGYRYYGKFK